MLFLFSCKCILYKKINLLRSMHIWLIYAYLADLCKSMRCVATVTGDEKNKQKMEKLTQSITTDER